MDSMEVPRSTKVLSHKACTIIISLTSRSRRRPGPSSSRASRVRREKWSQRRCSSSWPRLWASKCSRSDRRQSPTRLFRFPSCMLSSRKSLISRSRRDWSCLQSLRIHSAPKAGPAASTLCYHPIVRRARRIYECLRSEISCRDEGNRSSEMKDLSSSLWNDERRVSTIEHQNRNLKNWYYKLRQNWTKDVI